MLCCATAIIMWANIIKRYNEMAQKENKRQLYSYLQHANNNRHSIQYIHLYEIQKDALQKY